MNMQNMQVMKNSGAYIWTNHSKYKMSQYNLSPMAIKSVVRRPERKEAGIAPKTIAVMKRKDNAKIKKEIWVMYQKFGQKMKIISTWIYPGTSPKGKEIYITDDVWEELKKIKIEQIITK